MRESKDKKQNEEWREMLNWMNETGTHVLNENIEWDEVGEHAYVDHSEYGDRLCNEESREGI